MLNFLVYLVVLGGPLTSHFRPLGEGGLAPCPLDPPMTTRNLAALQHSFSSRVSVKRNLASQVTKRHVIHKRSAQFSTLVHDFSLLLLSKDNTKLFFCPLKRHARQ